MNNRWFVKPLIVHLLSTLLILIASTAYATSWARLEPNDVISRAELIVSGKYDIPDNMNRWKQQGMWIPFKFKVEKYYKGAGKQYIIAAIEQYDVIWAKEYQDSGGAFKLFLEKKEDIWVPVAGPNGMVRVNKSGDLEKDHFFYKEYKDFFAKQKPIDPILNENSLSGTIQPFWLISIVIVISTLAIIIWKKRKKQV